MLTCLVPVLFTFYMQGVLKLKNNSGTKGLRFLDFVTMAQDGGWLSRLRTRHLYSQEILLVLISVRG